MTAIMVAATNSMLGRRLVFGRWPLQLVYPSPKALHVQLHELSVVVGEQTFDHQFFLLDLRFARLADFAVARPARDAARLVLREPASGELAADEETKALGIDEARPFEQ